MLGQNESIMMAPEEIQALIKLRQYEVGVDMSEDLIVSLARASQGIPELVDILISLVIDVTNYGDGGAAAMPLVIQRWTDPRELAKSLELCISAGRTEESFLAGQVIENGPIVMEEFEMLMGSGITGVAQYVFVEPNRGYITLTPVVSDLLSLID